MLLAFKNYFQDREAISRGEILNGKIEAALTALPLDGIEKATFYPGRDDNGSFLSNIETKNENYSPDFTKEERRILASYLKSLRPTKNVGMRGPWERFGDINVDAGPSGRLRVIMTTRKSLGDRVLANVQIVGEQLSYSLYFEATDMWNWLKSR
jgi:hypothetical protein